ncbi:MAG: complex I subunit 1 family protein [Planctomycetota bacterium]
MGSLVFQVVVFPGFLFAAVAGLVTSWIDRKVTAKVQMRVGPPFLQPFYDVLKYMIKETCVPAGGAKWLFLAAPILGFTGVTVVSVIVWRAVIRPDQAFVGDLVVVLYLLTLPAVSVILGAFASRNPLASVGGSREMKLVLAYELPFLLACAVPVIQTHSLRLGVLVERAPAAASLSGAVALLVAIICAQAKLALVPFDMSEAETELTGGALIEYSGPPLGLFKLTRAMMLFTIPVFLVAVFWGGMGSPLGGKGVALGLGKCVLLVVIAVLIRNTAPRVRVDHAVRFFWGPVTAVAAVAAALAAVGW